MIFCDSVSWVAPITIDSSVNERTPQTIGNGSFGKRSTLVTSSVLVLTVTTSKALGLVISENERLDAVEDVERDALTLVIESIPSLALRAEGLLTDLLSVEQTVVCDWKERPAAIGADLSSVAYVTGPFLGIPREATFDLGLLEGGRGGEEEDEHSLSSHFLIFDFICFDKNLICLLLKPL